MEGQKVGEYILCDKLIAGGFSEVFLAAHALTRKRAVVKIIHRSWYKNPAFVDAELAAVRELHHKGIVKILHVEERGDKDVYMVMKFAKDGDLLEYCNAHILTEDQARSILKKVTKALRYMHSKGYVHRDLK
jgi:serine/threonine protein kinase